MVASCCFLTSLVLHRGATVGPLPIRALASRLGVTYEAVRQQVGDLERQGWLRAVADPNRPPGVGRPRSLYTLTTAGDHLFPKRYDDLAVELIDTVAAQHGAAALEDLLTALTRSRIERLRPEVAGKPLPERLQALRAVYQEDDPFVSVEETPEGGFRLVERNCPFLAIASQRPALCSVTVSALSALLGCKVVREERFQEGHGRCVFLVLPDHPRPPEDPELDWEPEVGEEPPPVA